MTQTCLVLAGGRGTRLNSVLDDRPKCLAPVGDRTFLNIQLEFLAGTGVDAFVLSLGYRADAVMAMLPELQRRYAVRAIIEPAPLGTGGAVLNAMYECGLDEALVVNGDSIFDGSLAAMFVPLRRDIGELLRMATVVVPDRQRFGGLRLDGNRITGFLDKGQTGSGAINAGLYRIAYAAFEGRGTGSSFSIESDLFPELVDAGAAWACEAGHDFIDIGVPDDYHRFVANHR